MQFHQEADQEYHQVHSILHHQGADLPHPSAADLHHLLAADLPDLLHPAHLPVLQDVLHPVHHLAEDSLKRYQIILNCSFFQWSAGIVVDKIN
jgi:hypothetical protein